MSVRFQCTIWTSNKGSMRNDSLIQYSSLSQQNRWPEPTKNIPWANRSCFLSRLNWFPEPSGLFPWSNRTNSLSQHIPFREPEIILWVKRTDSLSQQNGSLSQNNRFSEPPELIPWSNRTGSLCSPFPTGTKRLESDWLNSHCLWLPNEITVATKNSNHHPGLQNIMNILGDIGKRKWQAKGQENGEGSYIIKMYGSCNKLVFWSWTLP